MLFAIGDDWQIIYRSSGTQISLTIAFHKNFGEGGHCDLDTAYRLNSRIGEMANRFTQQNPGRLKKSLNSLASRDEKTVTLLDESQLDTLLDKFSGHVKSEGCILIPARYHHMRSVSLERAAIHWPKLQIDLMTIHASKGRQMDYVIVADLQGGSDGFPATARESITKEALLPPVEDSSDTEGRRLMYVALTRTRHRVWVPFNEKDSFPFMKILKNLDVPVVRKP